MLPVDLAQYATAGRSARAQKEMTRKRSPMMPIGVMLMIGGIALAAINKPAGPELIVLGMGAEIGRREP